MSPNNIFSNPEADNQRNKAMKMQNITKAVGALIMLATATLATESYADTIGKDPIKFYGDKIVFNVFRKGTPIGTHQVTFRRDGEDIVAETRFDISIKILVIPVYSYQYRSRERWRYGKLISLKAKTNDNGEVSDLNVERANGFLVLSGSGGTFTVVGDLYPTTHWNSGTIRSTQVINTITGKINNVELKNHGIADVATTHGKIQATHFAYQGDLLTEVWYDSAGKWVKMRFPGKDGVMIEYKCQQCGLHHTQTGAIISSDTRLTQNEDNGPPDDQVERQ